MPEEGLAPLLRQIFSPGCRLLAIEPIKASATPAHVYRLHLEGANGAGGSTCILKRIRPGWPDDPAGPDREANLYAALDSAWELTPQPVYLGALPATQERLVILEDLAGYRFPDRTHRWSREEVNNFLQTYARLHTLTQEAPVTKSPWLFPRHESRLVPDQLWDSYTRLVEKGIWAPVPGLEALLEWTAAVAPEMSALPVSLIHNDVFPPNIALPGDGATGARLLDWEMAAAGLPEMDLAFMFMTPYRSAAGLDRGEALETYWQARKKLAGTIPTPEVRRTRQLYADALWGLWMLPVAHRVAARPFPAGSPESNYWAAMFPVLRGRLQGLASGSG